MSISFYGEKKSQIMMLGGRRAGKSSLLASVVHNITTLGRGDLFTIVGAEAITEDGEKDVSLTQKRRELQGFITNQNLKKNKEACVLVNMSRSLHRTTYKITTRINGRSDAVFEFLDVPGEDMEEQVQQIHNLHYDALIQKAEDTDVVIVAIDTPFLMEAADPINEVYNRVPEIGKITGAMNPKDEKDNRLIILCPVKCEKWIHEGRIDEVTERTRIVYRDVINAHVQNKLFQIWIMPIATAGGLEHFRLMDGYRFRRIKKSCLGIRNRDTELGSINEITGQIYAGNGEILNRDQVEIDDSSPDQSLYHDFFNIPLSWYKCTGKYEPALCEQPAYHIIRFLARKAKENATWHERFWNVFSGHLDNYLKMVDKMEKERLIKTEGDGFLQVKDLVVIQHNEQHNKEQL